MSKLFFLLAVVFVFLAVLSGLFEQVGLKLFRLPGDIVIRKGNITFFFPLATSIVLSLVFTFLFNLFFRK